MSDARFRVGVISDTHDLLRPEVLDELSGSDLILHIGDVCSQAVLDELGRLTPVQAVRGNCDHGSWADLLPHTLDLNVCGWNIHMVHDRADLSIDPEESGVDIVIFGHSHKPHFEHRDGIVYLNPGSAGRRRFHLPVSVARVELTSKWATFDLVEWPDL